MYLVNLLPELGLTFGKKMIFFSKKCYDQIFAKTSSNLSKTNANIFAEVFGNNILEIITSEP
jgi:hypothetical protein